VNSLNDFLEFEKQVFGESFPIATYDPYLVRYGEYRFVLEMLPLHPGETILDVGCEKNIFLLYLAYRGVRALGVDLNQMVWKELRKRKKKVEQSTGRKLDLVFKADDATQLSLEPESVNHVIAISSIEHMFSARGDGDQLAMASIARVLKPGGLVAITLPTSNGGPFHEAPSGDERFAGPYRLYTPEAVEERILSQPDLAKVSLKYLAHTGPDLRYPHTHFFRFWMDRLTTEERRKWAWANPILADLFNPIVSQEEGERRLDTVNTVLICLRKKVPGRSTQAVIEKPLERPIETQRGRVALAFHIWRTSGFRSLLHEVQQYIRWRLG
jgi:SAM-dependent methyltransferase